MSAHTLDIPDDLLREAEQLARANNATLNELLLTAIAERAFVERAQKLFTVLAARTDVQAVQKILDRVPDAPPTPGDEIQH